MKQLSLVVALTVFTIQLGFSQIKKQYKDTVFNQTTVVVKDDKASDVDILNSMDLDDIGMDQIIQIKTAPEKAEPAKETTVAKVEQPIQEVSQPNLPETPVVQEQEAIEETIAEVTPTSAPIAQKEIKTTSRASNTATRSASKSSSSARVSKSRKSSKPKMRRFKKVKRKKFRPGKKLSCYKF